MNTSLKARHQNILTPFQREVLNVIFTIDIARESFGIAGGTAIAEFYLGHRDSRDLDIFGLGIDKMHPLADRCVLAIPDLIPGSSVLDTRREEGSRRLFVVKEGESNLQIDFSSIDQPIFVDFERVGDINVIPLHQLAVGKLSAVYNRTEIRDAVDLYFLRQHGLDIEELRKETLERDAGLKAFPQSILEMVERLEKIADQPDVAWPRMLVPLTPKELKRFLGELHDEFEASIGPVRGNQFGSQPH